MTDTFVCKSSRMAAFLIRNHCRCFKTDLDNDNQNYLVHLFDKDDNLNKAMDSWMKTESKNSK